MSLNSDIQTAEHIAREVKKLGGRVFYVGGFIRDRLRGEVNKDIDIEVHGISPAQLEGILDAAGERLTIGQSFGVYGLKGCSIDIAMPRREKLRGTGHKDFDIFVDPNIGTKKAAMRRDFTVNAIMQDVLTGEIIDHYGGLSDLSDGIIRHVNGETFTEDALRVLRGAQFASRFEFKIAPETTALCRGMDLSGLAKERVEAELKKALLKAKRPSVFFAALREMNQLDTWFSPVGALIGVEQSPVYHAEGDVWAHTMLVLDAAAKYRDGCENQYGFMLAALAHDFGKAVTTEKKDGVIHAYAHELSSVEIAEEFFRRINCPNKTAGYGLPLIENHMKPNLLSDMNAAVKSTNRMFDSVPDPEALIFLALSDREGQIQKTPPADSAPFLRERLNIYRQYMARPYVAGKDLVQAGLKPGEDFSAILAYAHKLRLAGVDKESALKQVLSYARKAGSDVHTKDLK